MAISEIQGRQTNMQKTELQRAKKGVRAMLTQCLQLSRHQELLIVTSESYMEEIKLLTGCAMALKIKACPIVIPTEMQARLKSHDGLPQIIRESIRHSDAMMLLVEYDERTTPFRMALLNYFTDHRKGGRACSMPGVILTQFHYANANYRKMHELGLELANILLRTYKIIVETTDQKGKDHRLELLMHGSYPAVASGLIPQGGWDNIPAGEIFVIPRRNKSTGSVVINGSLPGRILANQEEVVLHLYEGKITNPQTGEPVLASSRVARDFTRALFFKNTSGNIPKTRNAHVLGEFGIGINKSIKKPQGLAIFDEKMYGTVHFGFGRNDQLGGSIKGAVHHDLMTMNARVYFRTNFTKENILIIKEGKINLPKASVQLDWTRVTTKCRPGWKVTRTGSVCSIDSTTQELTMEWFQCDGIPVNTRIGNHETSVLAAGAYRLIDGETTVGKMVDKLRAKGIAEEAAWAALAVLRMYGAVKIKKA